MPNPFNITILDTSPIFQYYPSQDGPISTSWNATFSGSADLTWVPEALGVGMSAHRTSLSGASARLDWLGAAIYLYGDAFPGAYTIDLDGTETNPKPDVPGLLFAQSGLPYGPHSLILHVVQGTSITSIQNAIITVGMGETGTSIQNRTIDTITVPPTSDGMVLSGTWYQLHITYGIGGPFVPRIATDIKGSSIAFPITSATAFYIIGHVNFNHGPYHVILTPPSDVGPAQTVHYNGSSRWVGLNTIKYLATGLDRTRTYNVELTNDANFYYDQSQIVIFDTPPDPDSGSRSSSSNPSSVPVAAIAGGAVGCVVFFLIVSLFIFLLWRNRQTPQVDGIKTVKHNSLYANGTVTSQPNQPMPTTIPPSPPNTQNWVPCAEYPTNDLRPTSIVNPTLHPNPVISQPVANFPPTPFNASPPYPCHHDFTQEDARFFNNLHALNVPAADIVVMMESLRAERGRGAANVDRTSNGVIRVEPETAMTMAPDTLRWGQLL